MATECSPGRTGLLPNSPPKLGGAARSAGVVPAPECFGVPGMPKRFGTGTTPSAPVSEASLHFLDGAATPPNLGGELLAPSSVVGRQSPTPGAALCRRSAANNFIRELYRYSAGANFDDGLAEFFDLAGDAGLEVCAIPERHELDASFER